MKISSRVIHVPPSCNTPTRKRHYRLKKRECQFDSPKMALASAALFSTIVSLPHPETFHAVGVLSTSRSPRRSRSRVSRLVDTAGGNARFGALLAACAPALAAAKSRRGGRANRYRGRDRRLLRVGAYGVF